MKKIVFLLTLFFIKNDRYMEKKLLTNMKQCYNIMI